MLLCEVAIAMYLFSTTASIMTSVGLIMHRDLPHCSFSFPAFIDHDLLGTPKEFRFHWPGSASCRSLCHHIRPYLWL